MSKKSKRLEKENMQLTRKQEATNKNIFAMAEERNQSQQAIDRLQKENEKLKKLCRAMQTNGYGRADMRGNVGAHGGSAGLPGQEEHHDQGVEDEDEEGLDETDSEYDEYDEDEDGSVEGEYDEDTEEEPIDVRPRTYGPPPPPPPPQVQHQQAQAQAQAQAQVQQQGHLQQGQQKSLPIRTEHVVNGMNGVKH